MRLKAMILVGLPVVDEDLGLPLGHTNQTERSVSARGNIGIGALSIIETENLRN
jgi:hypothetical protein